MPTTTHVARGSGRLRLALLPTPHNIRNDTSIPLPLHYHLTHDPATKRLHVGSGYVEPVPQAVWDYEVSGKQVLTQCFHIAGAIAAGELLAQFQPEIPDGTAFDLGMAYILADRGADAVRILERVVDRNPGDLYANVMLAVAYAAVGRQQEAEQQAKNVRQRFPTFSRDRFGSALRDPGLRAKLNHALEKAGL